MHTPLRLFVFAILMLSATQGAVGEDIQQWHKVELQFEGHAASESGKTNPFTDYRLDVTFTHPKKSYQIRGFYAADGNAAETGADRGNKWMVRFSPDQIGTWRYKARLFTGTNIAVDDSAESEEIPLSVSEGSFSVIANAGETLDLRTRGRLIADGRNYRFEHNGKYWLKGGCDSPENLLAFQDFDGTYRISTENSEGEAKPTAEVHTYAPHVGDWQGDDPTWQGGKGKGLIGGLNYLSSVGINSIYFLTLNIEGDGKDVWPYRTPEEFDRFDCSRLDQWEVVFTHMQKVGIALHVVTQETENERLLDDGNTGFLRKLYYRELIARFGHHPALVWNLGEENGPADFSPNGQTADQQKAMATYLKQADPYNHPVVIHTHSTADGKEEILHDLLGHQDLDGLSFQVDAPKRVNEELQLWQTRSTASGHTWMIGMDEIGPWHTGVVPDAVDESHDDLRRNVLWGSLLAGANGVEWYFGARYPHNDLTSEDWRQRENIFRQTTMARTFFEQHLPFWEMKAANVWVGRGIYCFAKPGEVYALYLAVDELKNATLDLSSIAASSKFAVQWFDPIAGGKLQPGSVKKVAGGKQVEFGSPPSSAHDWVAIIQRINEDSRQ